MKAYIYDVDSRNKLTLNYVQEFGDAAAAEGVRSMLQRRQLAVVVSIETPVVDFAKRTVDVKTRSAVVLSADLSGPVR